MTGRLTNKVLRATGLLALLAAVAVPTLIAQRSLPENMPVVDAKGNMSVPDDYRTVYEFIGTWAVAADPAKQPAEMHTVYASPGTIGAFRETGKFPHDAVLIKEVFEVVTAPMTTGTVSRADAFKGWFVMVKDDQARFAGHPLWGDGWGWAWFDTGSPAKTTTTHYKKDCIGCHSPAQKTDWVFIEGYPPLKR